jgi:hypothetical protein
MGRREDRRSEPLDVAGGNGFRWIRVTLDVALRVVAWPALQLVGIGARDGGQLKGERMPKIVRVQWGDLPRELDNFSIMPAVDLLQHQVDRPRLDRARVQWRRDGTCSSSPG